MITGPKFNLVNIEKGVNLHLSDGAPSQYKNIAGIILLSIIYVLISFVIYNRQYWKPLIGDNKVLYHDWTGIELVLGVLILWWSFLALFSHIKNSMDDVKDKPWEPDKINILCRGVVISLMLLATLREFNVVGSWVYLFYASCAAIYSFFALTTKSKEYCAIAVIIIATSAHYFLGAIAIETKEKELVHKYHTGSDHAGIYFFVDDRDGKYMQLAELNNKKYVLKLPEKSRHECAYISAKQILSNCRALNSQRNFI